MASASNERTVARVITFDHVHVDVDLSAVLCLCCLLLAQFLYTTIIALYEGEYVYALLLCKIDLFMVFLSFLSTDSTTEYDLRMQYYHTTVV